MDFHFIRFYEQAGSKAAKENVWISALALAPPQFRSTYTYIRLMDSFRGTDYAHKVRDECILSTVRVLK